MRLGWEGFLLPAGLLPIPLTFALLAKVCLGHFTLLIDVDRSHGLKVVSACLADNLELYVGGLRQRVMRLLMDGSLEGVLQTVIRTSSGSSLTMYVNLNIGKLTGVVVNHSCDIGSSPDPVILGGARVLKA